MTQVLRCENRRFRNAAIAMALDKRLLEILCCPTTKQSVRLLSARQLEQLNLAQSEGRLLHADGSAIAQPMASGLLTEDGRTVYRIEDGIPVMLAEFAIDTQQVDRFGG